MFAIPTGVHSALCGLVAHAIPTISFRHNWLGLLQGYLHEGTEREMRVHIWHPSLERPGIADSGAMHDHRFDMRSYVLTGCIAHDEYELTESSHDAGAWQLHSVVPARKALAASGTNDGAVELLPGSYHRRDNPFVISAGWEYTFPRQVFHKATNAGAMNARDEGLTVTIVEKRNQGDFQARILAPRDRPVVHAFADPLPPERWDHILLLANRLLMDRWRDG